MTRFRLAAAVVILTAGLFGAFDRPAYAGPGDFPWCWEDYQACIASGTDFSDCLCYYYMCTGRDQFCQ